MDLIPENRRTCFSPTLRGCVTPSPKTARAIGEIARLALSGVIANIYRSLIFEEECALSAHFDSLAGEYLSYYRLLGRLTIALGGDPVRGGALRASGRHLTPWADDRANTEIRCKEVADAARELCLWSDRLYALAARIEDRVVCAVIETLADDAQKLAAETEAFF